MALSALAVGAGIAAGQFGCAHGDREQARGDSGARKTGFTPESGPPVKTNKAVAQSGSASVSKKSAAISESKVPATQPRKSKPEMLATTQPAAKPETLDQTADHYPLNMTLFPDARGKAIAAASDAPVILIARDRWTLHGPNLDQIVMMNGVTRITIHHTGFDTPWTADGWRMTADEIENIRTFHSGTRATDRHWADIAYHFLIDRAGRVWQGRPLAYQGAHVKNHNQHNLGIVLLGNFDLQRGSAAQLVALRDFVKFVRNLYSVPIGEVHTHHELADNKTDCPGTSLQAYLDRVRPTWTL